MSDEEKIKKLALSVVGYIESIKKVRSFMFEDLEKTIALVNTSRGAPNFMLALALCCYTEYWGKFIVGKAIGDNQSCFEAFFKRLGKCYEDLLNEPELTEKGKSKVYGDVRCGLAHAYMVEGNAKINMGTGSCGVEYDSVTKEYTFNIITYFEDFKKAVNQYIANLEAGKECFTKFESALKEKPTLI